MPSKKEQSSVSYVMEPDGSLEAVVKHPQLAGWDAVVQMSADGAIETFTLRPARERPTDRPRAPRGGVTTTLLRRVPLGEIAGAVRSKVAQMVDRHRHLADRSQDLGVEEHPGLREFFETSAQIGERLSQRPGRAGRSDVEYAMVAAEYVRLVAVDPTPVVTLASQMHLSGSQVRNLLYQARRRELLTDALKGRPGGRLTAKASALLAERNASGEHQAEA